ncbi:MAG TPA: tellurite resistance TerB family protein [Geminicoccaceae bacterium]|nr:tellurite resistance TerB family protein [Geminicoccaceae bacterium]
MLSPQEALIYTMVIAAEADHDIAEAEIRILGDLGNHLPIFRVIGRAKMTKMAMACSELLAEAGGREKVFGMIRGTLSPQLRATAYALACDVIAVDSRLQPNEMQALELIRAQLEVDPTIARAIERVAMIRFQAA